MDNTTHDGNIVRRLLRERGHSIKWLAKVTGKDRTTWGRKLKSAEIEESYLFLLQEALKLDIIKYFPRLSNFTKNDTNNDAVESYSGEHVRDIQLISGTDKELASANEEIRFLKEVYRSKQFVINAKNQIIKAQQEDIRTSEKLIKTLRKQLKKYTDTNIEQHIER